MVSLSVVANTGRRRLTGSGSRARWKTVTQLSTSCQWTPKKKTHMQHKINVYKQEVEARITCMSGVFTGVITWTELRAAAGRAQFSASCREAGRPAHRPLIATEANAT